MLSKDYKDDPRPEVRSLFKQTFGIVAFEDPMEVGGSVAEIVSKEARVALGDELNTAILSAFVPFVPVCQKYLPAC